MRTLDEFVANMIKDKKTPNQIRAVARSSRWEGQADTAYDLAKRQCIKRKVIVFRKGNRSREH
jgi:hypothetical protein